MFIIDVFDIDPLDFKVSLELKVGVFPPEGEEIFMIP